MLLRVLPILILLLLTFNCYSQNSARIAFTKGNRVQFIFESYKDIKNGKTLGTGASGHTRIEVYYKHATNPDTWVVDVKANTATLAPDYGITHISIDEIDLEVYLNGLLTGTYNLSTVDQPIAALTDDFSAGTTNTITINYKCAVPNGLMGYQSDVFHTDIIITLHTQ